MAARRADTPPSVLRLVRDEDGVAAPAPALSDRQPISESFYFDRKGTAKVAMKTARQFVIPLAVPFLVVAEPKKRRRSCRSSRSALSRAPSQTPLALDRPRTLARVKGYSLGTGRLTNKEKEDSKRLRPYMLRQVPQTRADCIDGPRPCIVARCRHNLYVTVNPDSGSIKLNFPSMLPEELEYTCALDAADEHRETGMTLERVGELNGLSLERVRQVEASGLDKLRECLNPEELRALFAGRTED